MVFGDVRVARKANDDGWQAIEFDDLSFVHFHTREKSTILTYLLRVLQHLGRGIEFELFGH